MGFGSDKEREAFFAKQNQAPAAKPPQVPLSKVKKTAACPGLDCPSCSKGGACSGKRTAQALVRHVLNSPLNWRDSKDARAAIGAAILQEAKRQGVDGAPAVRLWEDTCNESSVLEAIKRLGTTHSRRRSE